MSFHLVNPIPGAEITDRFGYRDEISGVVAAGEHTGVDLKAPQGTPIHAAHAGTVAAVWFDRFMNGAGAGGWMVSINSDDGRYQTRYAHKVSQTALKVGERVAVNQVVGFVGSTGAATGAHLHFELLKDGRYVDPLPYIVEREPKPKPKRKKRRQGMPIFIYLQEKGETYYAIFDGSKPGAGTWWQFRGQDSANQLATQYGSAMAVDRSTWDSRKKKYS